MCVGLTADDQPLIASAESFPLCTLLSRPAQRCWGAPAFEEISQGVRLVRPASASAPGEGRKVDQASQDPEAEAVQNVVGIVNLPARSGHEEPPGLPNAVAVHGEGLAGCISGLRRPAEDAATQLFVHEILIGLGRGARHDPEGDAGLTAWPRHDTQVDRPAGVGGLYLEPGLPPQYRCIFESRGKARGEVAGRLLRLPNELE